MSDLIAAGSSSVAQAAALCTQGFHKPSRRRKPSQFSLCRRSPAPFRARAALPRFQARASFLSPLQPASAQSASLTAALNSHRRHSSPSTTQPHCRRRPSPRSRIDLSPPAAATLQLPSLLPPAISAVALCRARAPISSSIRRSI